MSAMKGQMTVTGVLSTIIGDIVKMVSVPPGAVVPPPVVEPPPGGGGGGGGLPPRPDHTLPGDLPRPDHTLPGDLPGGGGTPPPTGGAPHPEHPIYYPPGTEPRPDQGLPGYQPPAGWPEGCPYPTPYGIDRALTRGLEGSAVVGELHLITTQGASRPGQVYDVEFTLVPGATVEGKGGGGGGKGQSQGGAAKAKPKSNFP